MNKSVRTTIFAAIVLIGAGMFAWAIIDNDSQAQARFKPEDSKLVSQGAQIYKDNCASCHGDNLEGEPEWRNRDKDGFMRAPPHDKSGHTWHHTDDLLFNLTKHGLAKLSGLKDYKTNMPIYDGVLSDDELIAVFSFIKSTWPEEIRKRHDQMNAQNAKAKQ